jgi:acyl-CoA synthetase (AMP-forming)/AMP-acid ligase II
LLLSDVISYHSAARLDDPAVIFDGQAQTFGRLDDRLHRLASAIARLVNPGERVAILSGNRPEYVECYYGVTRAGAILCLINFRLTDRELLAIVSDAEPSAIVVEANYVDRLHALRDHLPTIRYLIVLGDVALEADELSYEELLGAADPADSPPQPNSDDIAWLVYTSGTTGAPKGAMLSHRNLLTGCASLVLGWEREHREIEVSPGRSFTSRA